MKDIFRRPRYFSIGQDKEHEKEEHKDTRNATAPQDRADRDASDAIWTKCPKCGELLYNRQLENNLKVCQKCGHHFRLSSQERIAFLVDGGKVDDGVVDTGTFEEQGKAVMPVDAIGFESLGQKYASKLVDTQRKTDLNDALIYGTATIEDVPVTLAVVDFRFFGGSMGSVFGEKLARAAELAIERGTGIVTVSASGGARMQEGIFSLMQMAKSTAVMAQLSEAHLPHISVLVDPCTGGVTASYATSADIVMAEPGALIGFAGPRVIEQTIKQKLPADFQTSEFLLKHGMLDMVTPRRELRTTIARLLRLYRGDQSPAAVTQKETSASSVQ
ncbi:MAG TPA: acetyl-CoA carboxylase, carboxyltransferase subunit beta [Chloroflexia bacterium]|nr:acetyl-CoA carboxylase, carboxyltransferase subunit beta [Chloroflexia bacterium]